MKRRWPQMTKGKLLGSREVVDVGSVGGLVA